MHEGRAVGDASTGRLRRRSRDTLRVKANDGAFPLTAMVVLGYSVPEVAPVTSRPDANMSGPPDLTPGHHPPLKGPYLQTRVGETRVVRLGSGRVSYRGPRFQDIRYDRQSRKAWMVQAPPILRVKPLAKRAPNSNTVERILNKPVKSAVRSDWS